MRGLQGQQFKAVKGRRGEQKEQRQKLYYRENTGYSCMFVCVHKCETEAKRDNELIYEWFKEPFRNQIKKVDPNKPENIAC